MVTSDDWRDVYGKMAPRKRSVVWSFFRAVDEKKVTCLLCLETVLHCGHTTNMLRHLRSKHLNEYSSAAASKDRQSVAADDNSQPMMISSEDYCDGMIWYYVKTLSYSNSRFCDCEVYHTLIRQPTLDAQTVFSYSVENIYIVLPQMLDQLAHICTIGRASYVNVPHIQVLRVLGHSGKTCCKVWLTA